MSLRYIIRLIQAFFKRFKALIVVGAILGVIFFLLISFLLPSLDATHQKIGIVGRFTSDNLPEEISTKISAGLTNVDINGNTIPALAKSWESPDGGKTWFFNINTDLKWQDDKKLNVDDIKYKFSDATFEKVDEKTIKFNLDSQFSAFPVIVSKPLFKKGLIGTGEWEVKKVTLVGGYIQKLLLVDSQNNKITYKFYPTESRLTLAFKLGEIDIINKTQNSDEFNNWKIVNITEETNYNNFVGLFFNTENEKLAEKTVRQALAYGIDKQSMNGVRALSPISPYSWSYNPQVKPYTRDLEKTKDAKDIKIVISTLPNLLQTAEIIKKNWEEVVINSEIQVVTSIPENYEVLLATVDIPKDPDQYSLWHSTQVSTNISKIKNPRIDKLLEDGRTELDQEIRKKYYLDFQRFLVEEVPAVFLYHPTLYTITRK